MLHALHGNAGLPDDLLPLLRALNRPFHAWHLWQCQEEWPEASTLEGFARAFNAATLQETGGPRVLLGYSIGARLALHALIQAPEQWNAAILISPHPGLTEEIERQARLLHDRQWATRFLHESWDSVLDAWNAQPVLAGAGTTRPPERWRGPIAQAFEGWSLGRQQDFRPLLSTLPLPVLWLTGMEDGKFTALAREAAPLLPRGRLVTLPGAGHRVHLDQQEATRAAVEDFLQTAGL